MGVGPIEDISTRQTDGPSQWLRDHLNLIEEKVRTKAAELAARDGRENKVEPRDIAEAALLYAPGKPCPQSDTSPPPFWRRMALSITGVTLVTAALAIAFGLIGYFAGKDAPGAFDIAKIFAGAVVGSTGATLAANVKRD